MTILRRAERAFHSQPSVEELPKERNAANISESERLVSLAAGSAALLTALLRGKSRLGFGALGAFLLQRGLTGKCVIYRSLGVSTRQGGLRPAPGALIEAEPVRISKSIFIARPPDEVYRHWRKFEHFPRYMDFLQSVEELGPLRSRWVTKPIAGLTFEWESELIDDREGERIAWHTVDPSELPHQGEVKFFDEHGDTTVQLTLEYRPVAGRVGEAVSKLLGANPEQALVLALERVKRELEGEEHVSHRLEAPLM